MRLLTVIQGRGGLHSGQCRLYIKNYSGSDTRPHLP